MTCFVCLFVGLFCLFVYFVQPQLPSSTTDNNQQVSSQHNIVAVQLSAIVFKLYFALSSKCSGGKEDDSLLLNNCSLTCSDIVTLLHAGLA